MADDAGAASFADRPDAGDAAAAGGDGGAGVGGGDAVGADLDDSLDHWVQERRYGVKRRH